MFKNNRDTVLVVATILMPRIWITAIGIAGLLIALKFYGISRISNLSKQAQSGFKIKSMSFIFVSLSVILVGCLYHFVVNEFIGKTPEYRLLFQGITVLAEALFIALAWTAIYQYASPEQISISLGLLDRTHSEKMSGGDHDASG